MGTHRCRLTWLFPNTVHTFSRMRPFCQTFPVCHTPLLFIVRVFEFLLTFSCISIVPGWIFPLPFFFWHRFTAKIDRNWSNVFEFQGHAFWYLPQFPWKFTPVSWTPIFGLKKLNALHTFSDVFTTAWWLGKLFRTGHAGRSFGFVIVISSWSAI